MPGNPLIAQGSLNRIIASVVWPDFPAYNVTAPYLGKGGLSLALEGETTLLIPTMTGAVQSQEPYMMISLTMNLLKSQGLAASYKLKMEADSNLGTGTVRPDTRTLGNYQIYNCAIESVRELSMAGQDPGFAVTVKGYYLVNAGLWA